MMEDYFDLLVFAFVLFFGIVSFIGKSIKKRSFNNTRTQRQSVGRGRRSSARPQEPFYSQDSFSEDSFSEDSFPEDSFPEDSFPEDPYPEDPYSPGYYPPGTYPPGTFPPGTYPPGSYPEGPIFSQGPVNSHHLDNVSEREAVGRPKMFRGHLGDFVRTLREDIVKNVSKSRQSTEQRTKNSEPVEQPVMNDEFTNSTIHHRQNVEKQSQPLGFNLDLSNASEVQKAIIYSEIFKTKF